MANVRTDRWHNTGGNGGASAVWCRKRGDKSVVISVHRSNVVVDHWEANPGDSADLFAPRAVRTLEGGFWPNLAHAKKDADAWLGVKPRKSRAKGQRFSVIGYYRDNNQPFVSWETQTSPQAAAKRAQETRSNHAIAIVEVVNGHVRGTLENNEVL